MGGWYQFEILRLDKWILVRFAQDLPVWHFGAARMPPAPVRTPSKKSIAALPESSRLTFLLAASQLLASSAPQASSHLGCQALRWADAKQLPLPRGPLAQLCRHCGAHCNSKDVTLIKSSRPQRRRQLQADKQNRHSERKVAAVFPCQVCGSAYIRSFVNEDAAYKAFPQAAMVPTVRAAARRPAGSPKPAAVTGLGAAALSQAHHPTTNPHTQTHLPHNDQQVIRCADAGMPEMEAVQPQPYCKDNRSNALDRSSQPALTNPPVITALKLASVSSGIPATGSPPEETDSLTQQDLMVNSSSGSRQEAVLNLSHQKADSIGSLSHTTHTEVPEASGHHAAQPICGGEGTTGCQSDPVSSAGMVKCVDGIEDCASGQNQQEANASGLLQTVTDIALPAQSGITPAGDTLSRAPAVVALRQPFSWRKHGRSWRYIRQGRNRT